MLSRNLEQTLHRALTKANMRHHEFATLEHLLLALTEDQEAVLILRACGVDVHKLQNDLINYLDHEMTALIMPEADEAKPTAAFQRVLQRAAIHVQSTGKDAVTGANVIIALFSERESYAVYFLQEQEMTRFDAVNYLSHGISKKGDFAEGHVVSGADNDANAEAVVKKGHDALDAYCVNLNQRAEDKKIDPLIGRQEEVDRTIQILCRRTKNNPLYVGDPGVGKTAIAEGLARKIVEGDVPDVLKPAVIYSLDMGALLAGTRYRGDFEERLKAVVKEITHLPHAVLFIDEMHTVIGAGSTSGGAMDASNLLKPALAKGDLRCIGSTTYQEYKNHIVKDRALSRRLQKIDVGEPSPEETIEILKGLKKYYEEHHGVTYKNDALEAAAKLSSRYMSDKKLPDKAIDIIDEVGALQKLLPEDKRKKIITVKDIEDVVSKIARIPARNISKDDKQVLRTLDQDLKRMVFGQDQAVDRVVNAIKLARAGLREPEKPIGSYLFSGPTGVGKTEVAKQLALSLGIELQRFDMSEYMEKHAVSRLVGAPPGYVGFDQGGLLTDAVDQHPHCVLLLDEIEKAHPDIFNILLQVMDYGKLTDHNGKAVDFRNVILIMTSNAGAAEMEKPAIGFERAERIDEDTEAIKKTFSPEFRNRLDAVIPFGGLQLNVVEKIVDKFIMQLEAQLTERGIVISLTEKARLWIAKHGYSPSNGARPLARFIQDKVKMPLSEEILFGKLVDGGTVIVDLKKDEIVFTYPKKKAPAKKKSTTAKETV
jgi:ATP-dependent Clp protease ATP-binding subunit ClpA